MGYVNEEPLAEISALPSGEAGTHVTISRMTTLVTAGTREPSVRQAAEEIVRSLPPRDFDAESRAVEAYVRRHLRFTRDGIRVETVKTPSRMLAEIDKTGCFVGDCDDASVLSGSLLLSIGHPIAFQTLGRGDRPHHVNILDRLTGRTVDATGEPRGYWRYRRLYGVA